MRALLAPISLGLLGSLASRAAPFGDGCGDETHKLLGDDIVGGSDFGTSVAIHGTLALVGAPGQHNPDQHDGAVFVFDVATGNQLTKLLPGDGSNFASLGQAVALSGTTALAGAPGSPTSGLAYLFDLPSGAQLGTLFPGPGPSGATFGAAVGLDGGLALVGAPRDGERGVDAGAAHLFDAITHQRIAKVFSNDIEADDRFGSAVALHGTTALIGAPGEIYSPTHGSAYLFDATTGLELAVLLPAERQVEDRFGTAVALYGNLAIVGAPGHDPGLGGQGAAFLFDASTGRELARLLPTDPIDAGAFGAAVAIGGSTALVRGTCYGEACPGCVYVFDVATHLQVARLTGTGVVGSDAFGASLAIDGGNAAAGAPWDDTQGTQSGAGLLFGDGLRCAGGGELRLEVVVADADGSAASSVPVAATAHVSAGDLKRYQWWFRDPGAVPCGAGFNLSNGLELVWAP